MLLIYQFFRLIRVSNLVVILLTMSLFYGLLSNYHFTQQYLTLNNSAELIEYTPTFLEKIGFTDQQFMLLVLTVILIAASGNIINDYFDQKADRVNKPGRVIIDKYIKRRWAIILNLIFNTLGLTISALLAYQLSNWWIFWITFFSLNLLYFYSAIFKRKFLIGNLIVASLTAIVPFYVFVYGAYSNFGGNSPFGNSEGIFLTNQLIAVLGYCGFAFLLNLIREIIKDMADVKGDLLLQSKTIPIRFGFKQTKLFLLFLYLLVITALAAVLWEAGLQGTPTPVSAESLTTFLILIGLVTVSLFISLAILLIKNRRQYYLLSSNFLKLAMLFGVISALFYT